MPVMEVLVCEQWTTENGDKIFSNGYINLFLFWSFLVDSLYFLSFRSLDYMNKNDGAEFCIMAVDTSFVYF